MLLTGLLPFTFLSLIEFLYNSAMNLLSWLVFGLITGLVVDVMDKQSEDRSIISGMVLGMLGALLGGLSANLFLRIPLSDFNLLPLVVAAGGSLFILSVSRLTKRT